MKRIAIIGAGSWGTALAIHLSSIGHPVTLWIYERDLAERMQSHRENDIYLPGFAVPEGVKPTNSLEHTLDGADIVLSAIPSHVCRQVFKRMLPFLKEGKIIVSATKGIENESLMRMSQIIAGVLKEKFHPSLAVLSGPSFAIDVARHHPTAVVIASEDNEAAQSIQQEFYSPTFRLYTSKDIIGVELAGAFKNVIAIAAGVIDGIGYGNNTLAALITRGLTEMTRLVVAMGGKERTMSGLAGIGDLVLTCSGALSRNRQVGQRLGKGEKLDDILSGMAMIAEGVKTTKSVMDLSQKLTIEMPITNQVYAILYKAKNPQLAIKELMLRDLKSE
jgi:glycerol-3-phosphate dehydrogenase (NAD(P)+)